MASDLPNDEADTSSRVDALAELAAGAPADRHEMAPSRLAPGLRTATIESLSSGRSWVRLRGAAGPVEAELAPEVDRELCVQANEAGQSALVEIDDAGRAWIVGVVQTRIPERLVLKADSIVIEGDTEVCVRSGKSGLRLREDGDVELVGSRIMTMSRGLFRIVGRMLRLN